MTSKQRTPLPSLRCPVCSDVYDCDTRIPKCQPCGHTLCSRCLENLLSFLQIRCPLCKNVHPVTNGISGLATNHALVCMVEELCGECKVYRKEGRCFPEHCSKELCEMCKERHLESLDGKLREVYEELKGKVSKLESKTSWDDDECSMGQMIEKASQVQKTVNEICDKLQKDIDVIRTSTGNEIQGMVDRTMALYMDWRAGVGRNLEIVKQSIEKSRDAVGKKELSSNERLSLYRGSRQLVQTVEDLEATRPALVQCTLTHRPPDFSGLLSVSYSKLVVDCPRAPELVLDYSSPRGRAVFGGPDSRDIEFPWGISVSPITANVAITDNNGVSILSKEFQKVRKYTGGNLRTKQLEGPLGITISRQNEIFICDSDNNCIHVINEDGDFLRIIGSEGTNHGQFRKPRDIALDEDDELFVCDGDNFRIQVLKVDGSFVRDFGTKNPSPAQFTSGPCYIAVSKPHNKVIVSDFNHNLYTFTHNGQHLRKIRKGIPPYNLGARGLAIDENGKVVVADNVGNRLLILNDSLEVVATIGSGGPHQGQLAGPRGIALTSRGDIMVCDQTNNRVQLFKIPHVPRGDNMD